jgi:hypothetical protein
VIGLTFLAAIASDSWGKSPSNLPPRDETKSTQQPAASDQRGTEQSPAFVKIIPAPKTAAEAEADRREREDKNQSDWWLVKLTGALALIGFLQLVVFGWQGVQLKRTVSAAKEATELGNREFIATHRPRIIVRLIQGPFDDGVEPEFVWITVANVGETPATITAIGSDLARRKGRNGWLPPGLSADARDVTPSTLESGERLTFKAAVHTVTNDITIAAAAWDDVELCAVGQIRYQDGNGRKLEMAFLRIHDGEGNFTPSDSPEDEYQD